MHEFLDLLSIFSYANKLRILLDLLLGRFLIVLKGWLKINLLISNGLLSGLL